MATYEYKCDVCGDRKYLHMSVEEAVDNDDKRRCDAGMVPHHLDACVGWGHYRRVFGFHLSTYVAVDQPNSADERTFTTERAYQKFLDSRSQAATEATRGTPHDFQPVDLMDPRVRPDNYEQILRETELSRGADRKMAPFAMPKYTGRILPSIPKSVPATAPSTPPPPPAT